MFNEDKYIVIGHARTDVTVVIDPDTGNAYVMICDPENFEPGTYTFCNNMIVVESLAPHIQQSLQKSMKEGYHEI